MRQIFQMSAALRDKLPLGEQLSHVLDTARQVAAVDRLHLWAVSPDGDRLVYVTGSGLSDEDRTALGKGPNCASPRRAPWRKLRETRSHSSSTGPTPGSGWRNQQLK